MNQIQKKYCNYFSIANIVIYSISCFAFKKFTSLLHGIDPVPTYIVYFRGFLDQPNLSYYLCFIIPVFITIFSKGLYKKVIDAILLICILILNLLFYSFVLNFT
jgi:hypothetical protein